MGGGWHARMSFRSINPSTHPLPLTVAAAPALLLALEIDAVHPLGPDGAQGWRRVRRPLLDPQEQRRPLLLLLLLVLLHAGGAGSVWLWFLGLVFF